MTDPHFDITRRAFLRSSGLGLGAMALGELASAEDGPGLVPSMAPRAKRVIWLHMAGAPPQHDSFDPKPRLKELDRTPCPDSFLEGRRLAFIKGHPVLLGSPYGHRRVGSEGVLVGELFPHFASIADRVAIVRSMHTDQFNHAPAELLLFTGNAGFGGASMGSWFSWGLGSLQRDLPTFTVLVSGDSDPTGGKSLWGSGFLPSAHQGVQLRGKGDPILYVSDPRGMSRNLRRRTLDTLSRLNQAEHQKHGDPETLARIEQYELAYRMQTSVPGVMDIENEPESVREMYGAIPGQASFANNCLLARRLVESGVRFVQLFDWGWDIHGTGPHDDLMTAFPAKCKQVDQAAAALVLDLERRGLLDETLVVWGGEFGRTSMNEARGGSTYLGRDHHPDCFTIWMAGAGVHGGLVHGRTDELGYTIEEDPVSVRDLQATVLHLAGLDPFRLRYPYQGLEQRLIGPAEGPRVVEELFS